MKVGKAIYNILSQSKDVQSNFPFNTTDYSPTGTELVTNGDFSATGSNLVTNPNFTDTGSELNIADGSSPEPNHFRFVDYGTNTIAYDGSGVTTITYVDDDRGGLHYFNDGYNLSSPTLTIGKSYKIEITCKVNSGTYGIQTASTIGGYNVTGLSNTDYETHTIYAYVDSISGNWMRIDELSSGQVISINDVSIKELGEDWTAYTSGTSTVEYNSSGANLLIDSGANGGSNVGVYQENIFELGKSYKIVLSMKATASFDAEVVESNLAATENVIGTVSLTTSFQDFTFYYVGTGTFDLFIHRLYNGGGASQTISIQSVVVQELGEGWIDDGTPLKALTFDANGLKITSVNGTGNNNRFYQSTPTTEDDKSYKLTYTIHAASLTGSNKLQYYNGGSYQTLPTAITGTPQTLYFTREGTSDYLNIRLFSLDGSTTDTVTISSISVEEMAVNKIFPELAPPDIDAPYVVYSVVSNSPSETKNTNGDIDTASIEVYGFQDTYNKAVDLGVSVRAALDRKTGTYNTIEIQSTNYVNEQMDVNEARKLWAAIQDYSIRIKNL